VFFKGNIISPCQANSWRNIMLTKNSNITVGITRLLKMSNVASPLQVWMFTTA